MPSDSELDAERYATIAKIDTPEGLEQFAKNIEPKSAKHAQAARRRAIELRATQHGAATDAEREAIEAVLAYEDARSRAENRKFRATRTWQMIDRRGIIPAIEAIVVRPEETVGYRVLVEMGLEEMAFEAVVLRHPNVFSAEAVKASQARLAAWTTASEKGQDRRG